jgi:EAL domain-containing protein (putative c-di-GMP-specific phosphodiesterase class I)
MNPNQTHIGSAPQRNPDIARALAQREIQAYFLPKVDLRSARVVGVEALARWAHPDRGLIPAGDFLDLVEAGGHMRALTERVIEFSTRAAGDWWRSGLGLQLSVNLPLGAFSERDWNLPQFITEALAASGLPGEALQFEVTEKGLLIDPELSARVIGELTQLGASISVDDFGTGHFSLRQLAELPIEELKLDRTLIAALDIEEERIIVRSTIHLAHQMGLQVVAEGVESEGAWRQLRSMGCERAQGFLVAKPLPAREVPAWLASWNQRARELRSTKQVRRGKKATQRTEPAAA